MKKYILIAGVNGAGKSTLYQTLQSLQDMPRINTDEIVKEFGDWRNPVDVMTAGKIAVKKIVEYFDEGITFNQETTLCGKSIINNIKKAKRMGYFIELHYIGVDSVEIAKKRVLERVRQGGHGIPESDIERRYVDTFHNLKNILPLGDLTAFYDNTTKFRRFAICKNGMFVRVSHNVPIWFERFIEDVKQ
ncbi:MAG: zeta toxin family protein [Bacillus sp. (in: Bacteria)]|nr:zeta toxin family protein [Bacillus sp. (in: firmicutes)]MCM1427738.1 zeta toxin family protein [Eubacterium sp.]